MSHDNVGCKTTMSKMNRRNVLLGLGTAAAGSGIVFGSGAFTQVEAERDIDIRVEEDASDAIVQLAPNGNVDAVTVDGQGIFGIDIEDATNTDVGINVDSTLDIGQFTDPDDLSAGVAEEAFTLTDNSETGATDDEFEETDLNVAVDATESENSQSVTVVIDDDDGNPIQIESSGDEENPEEEENVDLDEGDADVALRVDTGADGAENISATITFEVESEQST